METAPVNTAFDADRESTFAASVATVPATTLEAPNAVMVAASAVIALALMPAVAENAPDAWTGPARVVACDTVRVRMVAASAVRAAVTLALLAIRVAVVVLEAVSVLDTVTLEAWMLEADTVVPVMSRAVAVVAARVAMVAAGAVRVLATTTLSAPRSGICARAIVAVPVTTTSFAVIVAPMKTLDAAVRALASTNTGPERRVVPLALRDWVLVVIAVVCTALTVVMSALAAVSVSPTEMLDDTSSRLPAMVSLSRTVMAFSTFMVPCRFMALVTLREAMVAEAAVRLPVVVRLLAEAFESAAVLMYAVPATLRLEATVVSAPPKTALEVVVSVLVTVSSAMLALVADRLVAVAVPATRLLAVALERAAEAA